jgi:hypothetical protein
MKLKLFILLICFASITFSCKKYLNINSDPSSPQTPDLASLMVPATSIMSKIGVLDIISAGNYIQTWSGTGSSDQFDVHGGNNSTGSVANALWRSFYAQQGQNINLVIEKGIQDQRWDYVGAAVALRAWGLMMTTQYFGEMPYHQAWDPSRYTFSYDAQDDIYHSIDSLCIAALTYLQRTDGGVNSATMARGDRVYAGDRSKWIKFVYGLRARHWEHLTNKAEYNADSVIYFVDHSFTSNADNFYITHTATRNDDTNPMGPGRDNFSTRRQSKFIVQLLDGTNFYSTSPTPTAAANRDPRLRGMLSASPDTSTTGATMPVQNGGYRFLTPATGDVNSAAAVGSAAFRQRPSTFYGDSAILNPAISNFAAGTGKYLFRNAAPYPIMTYHELQFIKAEAAFRKGSVSVAYAAYIEGISRHFDFVDFFNASANPSISPIVPQRAAYLASGAVRPSSSELTLTDIMLQKYIGDFGWNVMECWSDMRRYHYFDTDPITNTPVYRGYTLTTFSTNNQGPKPAYRYRPTNFSEFDWNFDQLRALGVGNIDYHTYEMWFSKP